MKITNALTGLLLASICGIMGWLVAGVWVNTGDRSADGQSTDGVGAQDKDHMPVVPANEPDKNDAPGPASATTGRVDDDQDSPHQIITGRSQNASLDLSAGSVEKLTIPEVSPHGRLTWTRYWEQADRSGKAHIQSGYRWLPEKGYLILEDVAVEGRDSAILEICCGYRRGRLHLQAQQPLDDAGTELERMARQALLLMRTLPHGTLTNAAEFPLAGEPFRFTVLAENSAILTAAAEVSDDAYPREAGVLSEIQVELRPSGHIDIIRRILANNRPRLGVLNLERLECRPATGD